MKKRIYVVYDERAMLDTDDASIFIAGATSLKEALEDAEDYIPCVIYSYADVDGNLEDERFEKHVQS